MINKRIENFKYGIINNLEAQSIPEGSAYDSLNFLTKGDKTELRRGSQIKGTNIEGNGSNKGLFTAHKANGTEVIFRKRGQKLEYYDTATEDWAEVGTNLFGADAESDDMWLDGYESLAGSQLFISSKNSGLYKIMTANPGSYTDLTDTSINFKGRIRIKFNRMLLWGRNEDKTGLYGSHIDEANYTTVTAEATASLTGTLAFKAGGATRTCFGVVITLTGTGEVYTDDYNGNLTGSLGGTGTINYTTGAYTLSNAGVGTADYQWEDSNNGGISDFRFTSPTRVAGEGFVFRQDSGGALQNVMIYNEVFYCLHENNTWRLVLTNDDTNADNTIYRENAGIKSPRNCVDTGRGIYFIDEGIEGRPEFKLMTLDTNSGQVVPNVVTLNIDLTSYTFTDGAMFDWGDFIIFTGTTGTSNNRMFLWNKTWESLDIVDYYARHFATDSGALICGDSVTVNVWTLFSGFDDEDASIYGYWISNISRLELDRLKKARRFIIEGEIQTNQSFKIYANPDRNGWTLIDTIEGTGDYVDKGQSVSIGAVTIGKKEIGGGGGASAYHYEKECRFDTDKFDNIQIKFEPQAIGYMSVSMMEYYDIRLRQKKISKKYRN